MNFLALKLDERTKIKMRRWYFNQKDDGVLLYFWMLAALIAGALLWIGYDAIGGLFR